jgi:hypothetical protein
MTTITWTVTAMDCYPQKDGSTDVVFTVHWTCAGTDGTHNASIYSTCGIPLIAGTFTPHAQLTQDQVLGWVWANGVDKTATEAAVEQQLQNQINPPVVTPALPWAAPTV